MEDIIMYEKREKEKLDLMEFGRQSQAIARS